MWNTYIIILRYEFTWRYGMSGTVSNKVYADSSRKIISERLYEGETTVFVYKCV